MELSSYERYGLHGNPFHPGEKEVLLQELEIYHVTQAIDDELALLKEGVFNRENKATVMLIGPPGIGKTHRLLLARREAELNSMFCVYFDIGNGAPIAGQGLLHVFLSKKEKRLSQPAWMKSLQKLSKNMNRGYDPRLVGGALAEVLNQQTPAFLLINGFHKLPSVGDVDRFLGLLSVVCDRIRHGVLVMMECDMPFFSGLAHSNQAFFSRIKRQVTIPALSDDETRLLLAKRLLVKRMVEDVDPLYPFTPDSVNVLNIRAQGNPQTLLQQAKFVFDDATKRRVITIDDEYIKELYRLTDGEVIDEVLIEEQPDLEQVDESEKVSRPTPQKNYQPVLPMKPVSPSNPGVPKRARKPPHVSPSSAVPMRSPRHQTSSSSQESTSGIDGDFNDEVSFDKKEISSSVKEINGVPLDDLEESDDVDDVVSTKFPDDSLDCSPTPSVVPSAPQPRILKKPSRKMTNTFPKLRKNTPSPVKDSVKSPSSTSDVKIKCPNCSKIFQIAISPSTREIQCPDCKFRGTIKQ
jgi:DNA-directed RNA polymerase subunit RPC12/RpoP